MDFWKVYEIESLKEDFGTKRLILNTSDRLATIDRHQASLSRVVDRVVELNLNEALLKSYSERFRYIMARDITFDLLCSIYDVNSESAMVFRTSKLSDDTERARLKGLVAKLKKPNNLELRFVGMQNGEEEIAEQIDIIRKLVPTKLVEVDIFGNETRHLVLDLKIGMFFNLLLENKIYRPGELVNNSKREDFEGKKSKLNFV